MNTTKIMGGNPIINTTSSTLLAISTGGNFNSTRVLFNSTIFNTTITPGGTTNTTEMSEESGLTLGFTTGLSIYYMFLIVSSIFFNTVLVLTIASKRKLQSVTNMLVVNMAIGDLITAVFVVPFDTDYLIQGTFPYGYIVCGFREIAFMLSLPSSVTCLLLLTIERFVSIVFPFKRIRFFSKKSTLIAIILAWSYNVLFALYPLMISNEAVQVEDGICYLQYTLSYIYVQLGINFILPVIAIFTMNFMLFRVASKHAFDMKKRSLIGSKGRKPRASTITLGANLKAAKTVLVLVAVFLICWLTFIVMAVWNTYCDGCHAREITYLGNAINYASIALNPILYGLRNSAIRREFTRNNKKLLYKYCSCLNIPLPSDRSYESTSYLDNLSVGIDSSRRSSSDTRMLNNETQRKSLLYAESQT